MTILRIGKPGRHHSHFDCMGNCRGPRLGLFVCDQRKGRNLTRTMARLTVVLQDRQHVFVERRGYGCALSLPSRATKTQEQADQCRAYEGFASHLPILQAQVFSAPYSYSLVRLWKYPHSIFRPKMLNSTIHVCPSFELCPRLQGSTGRPHASLVYAAGRTLHGRVSRCPEAAFPIGNLQEAC